MDPDQISQAMNDPQAFLGHLDWLAVAVSILAGFVVPWICAKLMQRKLGCIAYVVVGTVASSLFMWLMERLDKFFSHSLILDLILLAIVGVAALFDQQHEKAVKRWRTPLGSLAILVFLAAYIWAAMRIGAHLPDNPILRLTYYILAGVAWCAPLFPLLKWMAKDDRPPRGR